jgi:predicted ATPase
MVNGARLDSDDFSRRDDFCLLSSGGAIVTVGFREFGSRGHAVTVSAAHYIIGKATQVVGKVLPRHIWPR